MARPREHDEHTRDALLDAAEQLVAEGGAPAVSVRAVADRVGVSTRAVYSVYGSMPALMGALGARGFQLVADLVDGVPATDDPIADLVECGLRFRQFAVERPQLFRITFHDMSPAIYTQPDAYPALEASYRALADRIDRAIAEGVLVARPTIELAIMFHSITSGLALNEISRLPPPIGADFWGGTDDLDFEALWRQTLHGFLRGLGDEPTAARDIVAARSGATERSVTKRRATKRTVTKRPATKRPATKPAPAPPPPRRRRST